MRNLGWTVGLLSLLAVASATAARAQRLPGEAVPRHYEIHLAPNLASGELKGEETIDVEIPQATPTITLNAVGLELRASATAAGKGLAEPAARPAAVALDPARETATLRFEPPLPAGAARLAVEFTGRVRDDLRGLYRVQAAGRRYAITQFEGTYARMMFPCFDEPADKATFDLTVTVAQGDTAISNGAVVADRPGPAAGLHTLTFGTSPRMSTYLVALAVGEFQCVAGGADGIPIRVCALPEKKELGRFALAASERFLRFYNGYYGIRYPFGKLDMVAFPDYEWGGMENTAAIFYKERALLIDAASASAWSRRGVAAVVAHEMAHQWFGDLVTMRWWDDVWLNEGFATWMSGKPLAEWDRTWDQDVEAAQAAQGVLEADSLASTRPIRQNGETPAEIKELFDGVAYQKGAAMLRMVESYLGEPVFQAGVNAYLSRHAGGNATAEDLWSELARVSSRPVDRVLASFVEQPGAPLLAIETRCQGDTTEVTLSQQRFFLDPRRLAAGSPELWSIPVCLRPAGGDGGAAVRCELLRERRQSFTLDGCFPWVLANAGARGYYRSSYPPETLRKIAAAASAFSPAELV
ncbi:MAG TPA: M1 family metallopeptidase, partial [Thermoanaerobaculia bacterium]|nr:M1 family metallopeptidase [Thermoanaerobaculia bacterium]